jgi:hypothetical protein
VDAARFDALARRAMVTESRRQAVKCMAAGTLGLALARVGITGFAAKKCKQVTRKCDESSECCDGLVCRRANSQHYYDKTEKRCCKKVGAKCDDGFECCGIDVICNGGYCDRA